MLYIYCYTTKTLAPSTNKHCKKMENNNEQLKDTVNNEQLKDTVESLKLVMQRLENNYQRLLDLEKSELAKPEFAQEGWYPSDDFDF